MSFMGDSGLVGSLEVALLADIREFSGKMAQAKGEMESLGKSGASTGQQFAHGMKTASTAILAVGAAVVGYGVSSALKYEESLAAIQNQSNVSAKELEYLKGQILKVSDATATSSDQIASAYLAAEQAGLHYAAATNTVTAAAKTAWITGGNVVDVTKSLIAVEDLQVAKGMSVAAIADLMVKANKAHVGSMDELVKMMGGKVGAAMAAYNIDLGTGLAITDTLSKAQFTNTRAIAAMFQAMGKLEDPTKSATKQLASMGVNADTLASKLRQPNGLLTSLEFLRQVAINSGTPIQSLLAKVYGTSGGVVANVLLEHMTQINELRKTFSTASGAGLNTAFGITQSQLHYKLAELHTQIQNMFTGLGLLLLPTVSQLAGWLEKAAGYADKHPLFRTIASDAAIGLFAIAIGTKLFSVLKPMFGVLGGVLGSDITGVLAAGVASFGITTMLLNKIFGRNAAGIGDIIDYLEGKIHPSTSLGPAANQFAMNAGEHHFGLKGASLKRFVDMEARIGEHDFWDKFFTFGSKAQGNYRIVKNQWYSAAAVAAANAGNFGSISLNAAKNGIIVVPAKTSHVTVTARLR